jgi:WD40 repeat protein
MKKINSATTNKSIRSIHKINFQTSISKAVLHCLTTFIFITLMISVMISMGGCATMQAKEIKDEISNLSFSHDGKKVVFDRCREGNCQIQIYNLETGDLAAYQSPKNERWTMGKYSYDSKRITFSVIPIKFTGGLDLSEMQIAAMDADGKNYKKVTTGPGAKLYPTFSHSGKKILYARAARIRESGKTPAADYDAWEVDMTIGRQTQLTFFEYFYMGNLTYFPDDEQFIYYGELPSVFEGVNSYSNEDAFRKKMIELGRKGMNIIGVVVMKGKVLIPNPYHFPPNIFAQTPLLSKDGSMLIYEKSLSAGKYFLYSPDGNHRLVGEGGSVNAAAISPDGELLAMIAVSEVLDIFIVKDGKKKVKLFLPCAEKMENWENVRRQRESLHGEKYTMIPEMPSRILNR